MQIEQLVFLALSGNSGVTALVSEDSIYPDDDTQNVSLPLIKHMVVADKSVHLHPGRATLRNAEFYQVSCYASTIQEARQIADAVIDAIDGCHLVGSPAEGFTGFQVNQRTVPYDQDVHCAGIQIDFSIWYGE